MEALLYTLLCSIGGEEPSENSDAMMTVVKKDPEAYRKAQTAQWREWTVNTLCRNA